MRKLYILFRLLKKHKIKFIPWYFGKRGGTACYEITRYDDKPNKPEKRWIGVSLFKCHTFWESIFHEIGHIHHHRCIDFFSRYDCSTFTLRKEMYASRYAIRVLKLLGEDTQESRNWLCWAYGTYLAHFNKKGEIRDLAGESYLSVKKFGVKY